MKEVRIIGGVMLLIMIMFIRTKAFLPRFKHPISGTNDSISFLVVGDWGRNGAFNQSQVATQMGIVGKRLEADFVISAGDNFYDDGLKGVDDPAFPNSFTNIYTAPSLHKQWYTVLGNHDYRGNVSAQLSRTLRKIDKRWLCLRSYIVKAEVVDLFFVDTSPFQDKYFDDHDHTYDWRGIMPRRRYLSILLRDLNRALRKSSAKWKFVIGHHPIFSAGRHGNSDELITQLLPILKANNVDFYINGHDHCLEHIIIPDSRIQFMTSGGGSKAWSGKDIKPWKPEELKLYYDGQGFMSMKVTRTRTDVAFYDVFGNVLHKSSSRKP